MKQIAKMIDHTYLKADSTKEQITKLCEEAKEYGFYSVCVNPTWVGFAHSLLKDTEVKVCTVIGFPLGANTPEIKTFETINAIKNGANEIDIVINIGALKSKDYHILEHEIRSIVAVSKGKAKVKVIIETCLLTDEEIITICKIAKDEYVDFIKTSTGFSKQGATVKNVQLIRNTLGPAIGIKASGDVKTLEDIHLLVDAGATRIGTSRGVSILNKEESTLDY